MRAERLTRALRDAFAPFRLSAQALAILESLSCDLDVSYLKLFLVTNIFPFVLILCCSECTEQHSIQYFSGSLTNMSVDLI